MGLVRGGKNSRCLQPRVCTSTVKEINKHQDCINVSCELKGKFGREKKSRKYRE